jgi:amino acid transporter
LAPASHNSRSPQAGPDFISLVAGETQHPRRVIPRAYKTTIYRILFFYIGSALCVGINVPFDDASLLGAIAAGAPGAAKSPYVINMNRLGIPVLPDLVNAIVLTSVFSTASSFLYGSSRALYSLGLEGQAPKIVTRTTKRGVPYVAVFFILLVSCLSYLAVGKGSAKGEPCPSLPRIKADT